jgi:hypothetical protein
MFETKIDNVFAPSIFNFNVFGVSCVHAYDDMLLE